MSVSEIHPDWSKVGSYWHELWDQTPRDQLCCALVLPTPGMKLCDDAAMFLACAMALRGVGSVSPNPLVGAVVLDRDGLFLAAGAHLKVGESHAEVNALSLVTDKTALQDGSIFVTLEPCAHEGRTPSCAKMLCATGIKRVVYGLRDPNPLVNGEGHQILSACGKAVELAPEWQSRCEWVTRVFLRNQREGDIFTALKVASTTSGVIAGEGTSRLWITGERARQMGHFLRLEYDGILVGLNTLLLDDPALNIRHPLITGRTPLRIVLDPCNQIHQESRSFKILTVEPERTLVVLPDDSSVPAGQFPAGVRELRLSLDAKGYFDWAEIKKSLWGLGLRSLLIEGGAGVYSSALSAGSVNVIHWFAAPDQGQRGLSWAPDARFVDAYKQGVGVPLGNDRLLEFQI